MPPAGHLAKSLSERLGVHSVLAIGQSSQLVQALQSAGLQVEERGWSAPANTCKPRTYDIAVCLAAPNLPPADCVAVVAAIAPLAQRILLSAETAPASPIWLRAFLAAGYRPNLALDVASAGADAVLLQSGGADLDQADFLAELLRLRSAATPPDTALDPRYAELERAVHHLRESTSEIRQREERADLRLAHLYARTNQLTHNLKAIQTSRIWQTLVTAGGWILRAQQIGGRLRGRSQQSTAAPAGDKPIELHCDEPNAEAMQRILRSGISGPLRVKGWAVSEAGISGVELQIGDQTVEARIGLHRPELEMLYPKFPGAGMGGFIGQIDTLSLTNGRHALKIRAHDRRNRVAEVELSLNVDHIHGFASDYHRWIQDFEIRDAPQIDLKLKNFAYRPRLSILVPVYRTRGPILEKTIRSVQKQSYPDWELCLADDCSQSPEVDEILGRYAASDPRIKVIQLPDNRGISGASNAALEVASGEFIALLDHDDELPQDALFHVVDTLNRTPHADVLYSDEDHIDDEGLRSDPFFKPAWSPDLILGENYVCHFLVLRSSLCRELGGFRSETDLSQDMDIVLRASLLTEHIIHIPRILYHWRTEVYTGDRASDAHGQRALETSRRAVEDYLKAKAIDATVVRGAVPTRWRVRYPIPKEQAVRILVPCGGNLALLKRCLGDLAGKTDFRDFAVSVIDNSRSGEVAEFVGNWSTGGRKATYVDCRNQPFNYSAMNNRAARDVAEPLLLFLNDDVSMIQGDWLGAMVELASRPEVGAVGAKLLYPDNTIQHAGVVMGIFGIAGHAFKGTFAEDRTYFDFPDLIRNVTAVTGACMMVPTAKFWECGGFDEAGLPVAYNDLDLCLKLAQKGYRILYTPHAQLYHHEAISKRAEDKDPRPSETALFKQRWKQQIECDPFYSPNLTVTAEDYTYRKLSE